VPVRPGLSQPVPSCLGEDVARTGSGAGPSLALERSKTSLDRLTVRIEPGTFFDETTPPIARPSLSPNPTGDPHTLASQNYQ